MEYKYLIMVINMKAFIKMGSHQERESTHMQMVITIKDVLSRECHMVMESYID
jgi:hypothetical protein